MTDSHGTRIGISTLHDPTIKHQPNGRNIYHTWILSGIVSYVTLSFFFAFLLLWYFTYPCLYTSYYSYILTAVRQYLYDCTRNFSEFFTSSNFPFLFTFEAKPKDLLCVNVVGNRKPCLLRASTASWTATMSLFNKGSSKPAAAKVGPLPNKPWK